MRPALDRSSVPDQVFRRLAADVLSGAYAPGAALPSQRTLAGELGVNLASLREGLKGLERLRLVEVRHGDATRVADWRATGGLDVLAYALAADSQLIAPLFEARRLLLREAARLAAERRSDAAAGELRRLAGALAACAEDAEAQALDLAFFGTVIEASGNLVFTLILNSIRALYLERLEQFRAIVTRREELAGLYREAAEAIARRDPEAAGAAVDALAGAQEQRMTAGAAVDALAGAREQRTAADSAERAPDG